MGRFAKIIELEGGREQVLATIKHNEEDETFELSLETRVGNLTVNLSVGFESLEDAQEGLEHEFNLKAAVLVREEALKLKALGSKRKK